MRKLQSKAAHELAAEIQELQKSADFIEARLFRTLIEGMEVYEAKLALYDVKSQEDPNDNTFRGDSTPYVFDLLSLGHTNTSKRFVESLAACLPLKWNYMSVQQHIGYNVEGCRNVSARFNFECLRAILPIQ